MTDLATIEHDEFLPHPPAAVWRALTDPDLIGRWLMPNDFAPVVGHRFRFDTGQWGFTDCEVLDVEPERLLRYSWCNQSLDSTVTFRLVPEGNGTRVFLEHAGFDLDDPFQRAGFEGMGEGWRSRVLPSLGSVAAGVPAS
jgi:uncharacterized protein YndB with AHSA1/START domain